jgi:hypothetical protein
LLDTETGTSYEIDQKDKEDGEEFSEESEAVSSCEKN